MKQLREICLIALFCLLLLFAWYYHYYQGDLRDDDSPNIFTKSNLFNLPLNPSNRYLVLRNYNPEAGFCFVLYNVLCAAEVARRNRLHLVVLLDSGLYLEKNQDYQKQYQTLIQPVLWDNWWSYYFESHFEIFREVHSLVRNAYKHGLVQSWIDGGGTKTAKNTQVFEWNRVSFTKRIMHQIDLVQSWKRNIRLRPYMQHMVDEFYEQNMKRSKLKVSVHVRLTDKMGDGNDNEDNPVHYEYEWITRFITKELKRRFPHINSSDICLLICTDEQPFLDFAIDNLPQYRIVYTNSLRSRHNTGGLKLNSHLCKTGLENSEDCVRYRELASQSIHRGMKNESSYKKGQDILLDVSLMAKCDFFFASRGNASHIPKIISPMMQWIDMTENYTRNR